MKLFLTLLIFLLTALAGFTQETAHRIVSLAPSITASIVDLGMSRALVGISSYCTLPADAGQAVVVGSLTSPSLELIASLKPTVVFGDRESNRETVLERLESTGIKVVRLGPLKDLEDIAAAFLTIGEQLNAQEQAQELLAQARQRLSKVRARIQNEPRPRLFIEIWHKPLKTASSQGFIHSLFDYAGAENVFAESPVAYPNVSLEAVLAKQPEKIAILTHSLIDEDRAAQYRKYPVFAKADIRQLDAAALTQPNLLSFVESVEQLAEWIHPTSTHSVRKADAQD